jgi:hypothetical protein
VYNAIDSNYLYNYIAKKHAKSSSNTTPLPNCSCSHRPNLLQLSRSLSSFTIRYLTFHPGTIQVLNPYSSGQPAASRLHSYAVAINYAVPSSGFQVATCNFAFTQPSEASSSVPSSATPGTCLSAVALGLPPLPPKSWCSLLKTQAGQVCR